MKKKACFNKTYFSIQSAIITPTLYYNKLLLYNFNVYNTKHLSLFFENFVDLIVSSK